ncbi:magnesium transporter [Klebsiella michiganensis]|uniref:Magnesium transporter n=1 Tax=Klebsiella michiganensis TaxID=1134687 RepID=A0A7H4PPJ1_9ENTR|nr:magnesium transporter [Klebsiella michiganensis]
MSVLHKKSARLRDEERARLIWLLSTDKAVTSSLLGKLTLAERYDDSTLADDLAEVEMLGFPPAASGPCRCARSAALRCAQRALAAGR